MNRSIFPEYIFKDKKYNNNKFIRSADILCVDSDDFDFLERIVKLCYATNCDKIIFRSGRDLELTVEIQLKETSDITLKKIINTYETTFFDGLHFNSFEGLSVQASNSNWFIYGEQCLELGMIFWNLEIDKLIKNSFTDYFLNKDEVIQELSFALVDKTKNELNDLIKVFESNYLNLW
ncbi:hypothetical protein F0365_07470 [Nonlabens sp. Ci31]|jgi:hypothetical protein|uniref:hypothetical protein n=1 Tax=Nonlabens sp. Ci31 TaxID=2608253 RepID=UPI00146351B2|nr:hypothetical protein [Nonlabens sp. Ci31]QJP34255.1 hypothetical protein F0365_07470 [Nonlabens sp. Ci31]